MARWLTRAPSPVPSRSLLFYDEGAGSWEDGRRALLPVEPPDGWEIKPGGPVEPRPQDHLQHDHRDSAHETSKYLSEAWPKDVGGNSTSPDFSHPKEWFHERWVGGPSLPGVPGSTQPLPTPSSTPSRSPHPSQVQTQPAEGQEGPPRTESPLTFLLSPGTWAPTPPSSSPRPCQNPGHRTYLWYSEEGSSCSPTRIRLVPLPPGFPSQEKGFHSPRPPAPLP